MLRAIVKLGLFLSIVGACVFALKMHSVSRVNEPAIAVGELNAGDTSFFFLGSSRVQKSIDPGIISRHYDKFQVFNLGISGGSFLSNCVMADFIIRQPGNKVLFIELAPLLDELPDGVFNFARQRGLSPSRTVLALTESESFPERSMLIMNTINHQVFKTVSVWKEVREVVGYKREADMSVGYHPYDKMEGQGLESFLTRQAINASHAGVIDLTEYTAMIGYLNDLSKNNNSRVVFFLPITIPTQFERRTVIPLYSALPDTMKLEYPAHFLQQIARQEYLGDANHLNRQGANTYSSLLVPLLERYWNQ